MESGRIIEENYNVTLPVKSAHLRVGTWGYFTDRISSRILPRA